MRLSNPKSMSQDVAKKPQAICDIAASAMERVERILQKVQCLNDQIDGAGAKASSGKTPDPGRPSLSYAVNQICDMSADIETVLEELQIKLVGI